MSDFKKWEYRFLRESSSDESGALDELNELGEQGWEVAAAWSDDVANGYFLLKRPKAK